MVRRDAEVLLLAHVTEEVANEDRFVEICHVAEKNNQPMYLIVKEGVDWSKFKGINWRKKYFYKYNFELQYALSEILKDYKSYEKIQCFNPNEYRSRLIDG